MKKIIPAILLVLFWTTLLWGQKTFENKKFGFSMQEPKDWIVITNDELGKNIDLIDITEEKLKEMLKTSRGTISLTAYIKYEVSEKEGLIPKIQIDIRPKNTKDFQQFKTSFIRSTESFKKYYEDFEFIQKPKEVIISGIKSIVVIGKFTIKTQKGQEMKVRARVYAVPYKNYFFQVNLVDGQFEEDNSKLFDELVKTIRVDN